MLEDLLEQEKREQEKQQLHSQGSGHPENPSNPAGQALLSDQDFERLKADVFSSGPMSQMPLGSPPQGSSVVEFYSNAGNIYNFVCLLNFVQGQF